MISPYSRLVEKWKDCQRCPLKDQRTQVVFARGNIPADVLFIGEAPGASEDILGSPFVGPAGKLLDQIIQQAMPINPEADSLGAPDQQMFSTSFFNLVGCFPKEAKEGTNHEPPPEAIKACSPRLAEFVMMCKPKLIVYVGSISQKHSPGAIKKVWNGKTLSIVHPAAILRAPDEGRGLMAKRCVALLTEALEGLQ